MYAVLSIRSVAFLLGDFYGNILYSLLERNVGRRGTRYLYYLLYAIPRPKHLYKLLYYARTTLPGIRSR